MHLSDGSASVRVRVPATSANLGPGFDALGLALDLYDDATITLWPEGQAVVDIAGIGADSLPRDERHLLLSSLRRGAAEFGLSLEGIEIRARNTIPQGRGLGSSAATIVAGVAAAWLLVRGNDELDRAAVLNVAAGIEGHPDNVAACVLGGLTISWQGNGGIGGASAVRVPLHGDIRPVLFLPPFELSTDTARGLLPPTVPFADAAFTAGRSALLIHALGVAPDLLMDATEDRLHQRFRSPAMPEAAAVLDALRNAGIPAVISGAGPSVLALCGRATLDLTSQVSLPPDWTRQVLAVAPGVQADPVGPPGE